MYLIAAWLTARFSYLLMLLLYVQVVVRLSSDQEELYLALDKYKSAVAQLAGVTTSRVAVLSFLTSEPATSLIGRRLQDSSTWGSSGEAGSLLQQLPDGEGDSSRMLLQTHDSSSVLLESSGRQPLALRLGGSSGSQWHGRQLRQLGRGQLEVYSRIATLNADDTAAITARINNATRQADFEKNLAAAGLKLVPGSISVRSVDSGSSGSKGWGLPGVNMSDPNTRRIIIIVACSVGAGLLVILLGWAVSCCVRRKRAGHNNSSSQQQFLSSSTGYNRYYGSTAAANRAQSDRPANGRTGSGSLRGMFGAGAPSNSRGQPTSPNRNGRPVNPFAGTNVNFGSHGTGGYSAPAAAVGTGPSMSPAYGVSARQLPVGGYTVNGQTFMTAKEAEEYQLALALQQSLQQSGPPGHYLPHSSGQQQSGYPPSSGYGFGRR